MPYQDSCRSGAVRCRRGIRPWLAAAVLASVLPLLAAVMGCSKDKAKNPEMRPAEVTVVTVTPRDIPVTFEFLGRTQSSHQVSIQARVSGFLDQQVYTEGSIVKAGQLLFLMDKKPFQAQVDGMIAALARQRAALETARLNLERTRPLVAQHALSQKDLDEATGNYHSAAAAVEQSKSQLETARLNLSYCTISSPITGITGAALQQEGSYLSPQNSQLTTVAALSPIWVNFSLSENEMQRYRDQVASKVLVPPPDGKYQVDIVMIDDSLFPQKGLITFAAPAYDAQTGTFLLRVNVANPDGILRPNQYVRVRLHGAVRPEAIVVPQRAVLLGAKGHFVWVVSQEGKAEYRPVTVGEWHGNDWFIAEGLRAGDRVVIDGGLALQPGAAVAVRHPAAPAGPAAPSARTGRRRAKNRPGAEGRLTGEGGPMFSRFFIERPIFATVVSLIIVIAGLVSMKLLPVAQYPTITPVQIQVTTTYPGADAKTVGDAVAAPIEAEINGVDNMLYMTSTSSSTGQLTITVYFSLATDPDIAQVQVQNRVNLALPRLPEAVTQYGVSVQKKSSSVLMIISVFNKDGRYSPEYVSNYANVYVLDAIKRVKGAGQAQILGVADQAMRIWMDPDRMASLGITTTDIQNAVAKQNALFGAGQVGQQPSDEQVQLTFPVVTQAPFVDPAQYEDIILRANQDGSAIVRVKDVAHAEVGRRQYIDDNRLNGAPATPIMVYQQPGANGLEVSGAVRQTMEELKRTMPAGIDYLIALDTTDFVRISIEEVIHTLFEAIVLVMLVVFLFLQSFRSTFICTVAIFVALIGTFTGMLALGFSINLLTLFGIVLAIGMVVDDAIVVVENVERNMAKFNLGPREATLKAMGEIGTSLIAVVLVMASVFIPAAFLPGTTGQLYKQFAITIVISVALSGFVALTLTPAMCAALLRHTPPPERGFFAWFNRQFDRFTAAFGHAVVLMIKRMAVAFVLLAVMIGALVQLFRSIPTSFVPNEDQGYVLAQLFMPDAASLQRTAQTAARVDELFALDPAVANRTTFNGYSLLDSQNKANTATFFVTLKDFKERYASLKKARAENAGAVLRGVGREARGILEGRLLPIAPPAIPGIGTTGGFEFWIQDRGGGEPERLYELTQKFLAAARQRPELARLNSTFRASSQQLRAEVDRSKAVLLGVPVEDVYSALQAQFGSIQVSQFNQYSRVWNVILQSAAPYRRTPADLTRLYTRSNNGQMVPLSALVTTSYAAGPDLVPHFNGFPAAQVTGGAAEGFSSGEAIGAMEEVAAEVLPQGYGFAWSGMAFEEKKSGGTSAIAFIFGLIIVFLVLAAQFESWTLPGAVMTAVPFGILGALAFNWLRGLNNDVYFQIGLLVLIGLGAKNAVLRVTFAVELRRQGLSLMDATIQAGEERLRPIIMTSLAFIFGVLPLAVAAGAGANARHSIGTGIMGGMIGEATLAMLYVPLFFYIFARLAERKKGSAPPAKPAPDESAGTGGAGMPAGGG